jgi:hypothetical protein
MLDLWTLGGTSKAFKTQQQIKAPKKHSGSTHRNNTDDVTIATIPVTSAIATIPMTCVVHIHRNPADPPIRRYVCNVAWDLCMCTHPHIRLLGPLHRLKNLRGQPPDGQRNLLVLPEAFRSDLAREPEIAHFANAVAHLQPSK